MMPIAIINKSSRTPVAEAKQHTIIYSFGGVSITTRLVSKTPNLPQHTALLAVGPVDVFGERPTEYFLPRHSSILP